MIRFTLFRFSDSMELRFHLFSETVKYENGSWMASRGWFRQIYPDGTDEFREISGPLEVGIPENPAYFGQEYRNPAEMSQQQLRNYISELNDSGYRPVKLIVRWHDDLRIITDFILLDDLAQFRDENQEIVILINT